ncbi:MAG: hypothetical protein HC777_02880 [Hyphomonadaceae bacterium]|nr:hypothetical protein [Hyphomonadaceae bacterium]
MPPLIIRALLGVTRLTLQVADVAAGLVAIYESDEDFKRRIQMAPETWTGAGPRLSYVARAARRIQMWPMLV